MKRAQGAFTLVELLVVIAIILLLAALLARTLAGGKERGRRAVCLNNLRQFSLGLHLYGFDQSDRLPAGYSDAGEEAMLAAGGTWPLTWMEVDEHIPMMARSVRSNFLQALSGDEKILNCPGLGKPFTASGGFYTPPYGVVLGYNYLGGHEGTPWENTEMVVEKWISPRKLTDDPNLVILTDLNDWSIGQRMTFVPHGANGPRMTRGDSSILTQDGEDPNPIRFGATGGNVAWLNGSARWKNASKMKLYRGSRLYGDDGALAIW